MIRTRHRTRRRSIWGGVLITMALAVGACDDAPLSGPEELDRPTPATTPRSAADNVLVGAGNIARCDGRYDEATARLLAGEEGTVFTTGDNVHANGSLAEFRDCYDRSWGEYTGRTRPAVGDREYRTTAATGYFQYFGEAAGESGAGYYSYDVGEWHVVVLNSSIAMDVGSPQEEWLRADLAANGRHCTLAYWHYPRFSSYSTSVRESVKPLWDALYEAGAEVVINGHYRVYERFAPQTPDAEADPETGVRQFTVGTGGHGIDGFGTPRPHSEVRHAGAYGVLKLRLDAGEYAWDLLPIAGEQFTDAGKGRCHGRPGVAPVRSVEVTPSADTVVVGETVELTAIAKDEAGNVLSDRPMIWMSTDTLTAKVTTGLVSGVAVGTAFVVATSEGVRDTATVTVIPVPVASVSIDPGAATLDVGNSVQLTATPRDARDQPLPGRTVEWASSAPAVAAVDATGEVTAMSPGSATITATSEGEEGTASVTVTGSTAPPSGYFAAPNGSSDGDGTLGRPWSLATALAGGRGAVQPGDTVWLRGGTYRGPFTSTVVGAPGLPVVIRQYPGERAVIDGAGTSNSTLQVRGDWSVLWGFEVTNSDPTRTTSSTGNSVRPNTVVNNANNTKYINLVVHDGGVAFYNYTSKVNVEVYGSIFYNNGWQGPDRGHGHALYIKSDVGPVLLRDNVLFNQFGYGVHAYTNAGSGNLNNIILEGNVAFNNGALSNNSTSANVLIGGYAAVRGSILRDNVSYVSPGLGGKNVKIGYSSQRNVDVTMTGNYLMGGDPVLDVGYWTGATLTANTLIGNGTLVTLNDPATGGHLWSANTHHRDPVASAWRYDGTRYPFDGWRVATGLALADVATAAAPEGVRVFVRPNLYEPGRATVTVVNRAGAGSVSANLSGVLPVGASYEVRRVEDLFGPPVATGTYGGGAITLPVSETLPPAPVGMSAADAPRTGRAFGVFVVTAR